MCTGEECGEDVPPDPLQPVPEDQCQAGGHQQRPGASSKVRFYFIIAQIEIWNLNILDLFEHSVILWLSSRFSKLQLIDINVAILGTLFICWLSS